MGIEAASAASSVSTTSNVSTTSTATKTKSDTSFKDEMSKVSETESKNETKAAEKESSAKKTDKAAKDEKTDKKSVDTQKTDDKEKTQTKDTKNPNLAQNNQPDPQGININPQLSFNDANQMLSTDIQQMIENTASVSGLNKKGWGLITGDGTKTNIAMTESDADFFINLTQNDNNVNIQGITSQAQNMLNNGVEASQVKQNFQVSQTLLNALSESRQNNQPVRIDFDQNVSVILRVGKDGALSAQFIPGDKAVEQYLRQNIDSLRTSFDEQDLPYSDLSYSNSSKDQNQRRREQQRQGE